jgi:hypothetical protein
VLSHCLLLPRLIGHRLASRQRKKKHTEELEHKEKNYTQQITALETTCQELSLECQRKDEQQRILMQRLQESQRMMESLQEDMRCLKLQHNEETSSLRSKINYYRDQIDLGACHAPAMSAAPSSTGFSELPDHFGHLAMQDGMHDWEEVNNFTGLTDDVFGNLQTATDDFDLFAQPSEQQASSPVVEKQPSTNTLALTPSKKTSSEQQLGVGLLFTLLLCGAFVASKSPKSQPPGMPKVPAEVRAAAPALLHDLLAEPTTSIPVANVHTVEREPQPSGLPYQASRSANRLEQLHQSVMTPTKQQEYERAAQLTSAQYASISNMNYDSYGGRDSNDQPALSGQRRNLAEVLANMQREHQQSSKAEVYTRSLLWDQIPTDVVRQFKEMVRDHDEIEARQKQRAGQPDDAYGAFKVEA